MAVNYNSQWGASSGRAAPNAVSPVQARSSGNAGNMTPFNPAMSGQNYFQGVPPWGSGQSNLSMQNPMMGMGNQQGGWGNQLQAQNPMMSMGGQQNQQNPWKSQMFGMPGQMGQGQGMNTGLSRSVQPQLNIPAYRATSNPYMPSFQQSMPQQAFQNPQNPYQNDWNWSKTSPFAGARFPAY